MSRSREHVGTDIGAGVCVIVVDSDPGDGPRLHRHPYEEVFVMHVSADFDTEWLE
jgi:hypothetical protein